MKVVILCGGKGTRFYPFTEYFPKAMMPLGGTPVVVHLMRIYAAQGFREFILAAGHRREILLDYFDGRFKDWQVRVVDTGDDADTGERLLRCRSHVGDTFLATYGDGLGDIDLQELLNFHRMTGGLATVTSVPLRSQYGTVQCGDDNRVARFVEKPVLRDYWINAGFFVFNSKVFDHWNGQNLENQVLPSLASQSVLYAYHHEGFWKSMDTSKDQQEFEQLLSTGNPPWLRVKRAGLALSARA